jgi:signal transduction histidine kinase
MSPLQSGTSPTDKVSQSPTALAPESRTGDWKADILLVDDEPKNLMALEALLEPLGQNLIGARSGGEALRLVLNHDFAVIVLDVRMPVMDGFETARMIRGRERSSHIPIIFLTGLSREVESTFRGYEVGAVDYLMKPVVPEVLRSKVSVFIELHRKNMALASEITERKLAEDRLRESEVQLRALAARLFSIREDERARIAREIHDELGQVLTGLKMDVAWLAKQLDADQKPLLTRIDTMRRLIDSTVQVVRRISTGMRPEILDDMGLVAAIRWQAKEFQKRLGLRCRVELPGEQTHLGSEFSTAVFRIFQEMLTNIARHAKAANVTVKLNISRERLTLKVTDDGVGIAESAIHARESLGLLGMRERAQLFGGEVVFHGSPGHGTTVSLSIPLSHQVNQAISGDVEPG